MMDEQRHVMK